MRHRAGTHTPAHPTRRRVTTFTAVVAGAALVGALVGPPPASADPPTSSPETTTLTTGIAGANGSTIGPDGALYVTESDTGRVLRVDRSTGATSVYASGLPTRIAPIGGPMDLVFHGDTLYVLVSLVGEFFGSPDPSGIYRMDGPDDWTVIADLGAWAVANPPGDDIEYFITTGVHYSIDRFRGGFVVAEAHHNKVLLVTRSGTISEFRAFGNIVPTGLETWGQNVLVAMAGPQPHVPADGQILSVPASGGPATMVAAGGALLVDVERGRGGTLFGLAQGHFTPGQPDGSPADPETGQLLLVDGNGGFTVAVDGLDRPTSLEIVGTTAFVVSLTGTVFRIDGIASPPFRRR